MRIDRVSLQLADGEVRTFEFHRGLTVVEAEPGGEEALARALLGTLGAAGDGVHVELSLDDDASLVVFRPFGAPHRVIDLESSEDRSVAFARQDGRIDVLGAMADGHRHPARDLVVGRHDLADRDPTEAWITSLAEADVARVLDAAEEVVAAEEDLRRATAAGRRSPDASTTAQRTAASARARTAERRFRVLLPTTAVVGTGLAIGAVVGVDTLGTAGSLALIGGSLGLIAGTLLYGRTVNAAFRAERRAGEETGEESAGPVSGAAPDEMAEPGISTDGPQVAGDLATAAGRYQASSEVWTGLAGNIPAPWALGERQLIERTAELRQQIAPDGAGEATAASAPTATAIMAGLTVRLAASRAGGAGTTGRSGAAGAERLPLFLDNPLHGLSWAEKVPVLEFLGRLAAAQQLVLVTADPETLSWARLEAMAGWLGTIIASGEDATTPHSAGARSA